MAKHFKNKKQMKISALIKYLFILLITYITIKLCIYVLVNTNISVLLYSNNKLTLTKSYITKNTINKPLSLLNYKAVSKIPDIPLIKTTVYIYNTHQTEAYLEEDGVTKTVKDAAYIFKDKLEEVGINTIVENGNIEEFLIANNMSYNYSYEASRYYLLDAMEKNKFDLYIDLHRDALERENSTMTLDGIEYARILFVIGTENATYNENLELANRINDIVNLKYPGLSRGVLLKNGVNANGVYNQDLSGNVLLLEIGGNNNTITEVTNTIAIMAEIIGGYLNGKTI